MSSNALAPAPATDPATVLDVCERHRELHPYGIADVVQLWDRSTWWRDGAAVVGVMDLLGSPVPVLYAVSATEQATLDLVGRVEPALPPAFMATGPEGLAATLAPHYASDFVTPYLKMHLAEATALPASDPEVVTLTHADLAAVEALFSTDRLAGDFFHPGLLETGFYLGIREEAALIAAGGIHVLDAAHGVAAIGNVTTHPAHRCRGHGRRLVATLCRRLLEAVPTVGLNVRQDNPAARRLYESLGFETILPYEETLLRRR